MRDTRILIRDAFSQVPQPVGSRAIAPHVCDECDKIEADLSQYTWETLPPHIIDSHADSLPLLSPAALQHYLPAWLIRALDDPSGDVIDFTIYQLTPSKKNIQSLDGYFEEWVLLLSDKQKQAISAFFNDVEEYQLWEGIEGELIRAKDLWSAEA